LLGLYSGRNSGYFASIAQAHYLDRDALVVYFTDQPPIADPILPAFA